MSATQKTTHICSTVNVTSDVNYGVIPFTVHFLYESIKTDSICVAHVTIYLSTKKKKKAYNKAVKLNHLIKTGIKDQITLTQLCFSLSCTVKPKNICVGG